MNSTYVLIDLGSRTLRMAVMEEQKTLLVRALAVREAHFLEEGRIINREALAWQLQDLKREVEEKLNSTLAYALVNLGGGAVHSLNHSEALPLRTKKIRPRDVHRLIQRARQRVQAHLGEHYRLIHFIEQVRRLQTGADGTPELHMGFHAIAVAETHYAGLQYCLKKAKLKIEGWVFNGLAAAAALRLYGQEESFCALDLGASSADYSVFHRGKIFASGSIPRGGEHISAALAQHFFLSRRAVEALKRDYAALQPSLIADNELPARDEALHLQQHINKLHYCKVLGEQYGLIMEELKNVLTQKSILPHYKMDFILSGGAAQMQGLKNLFAGRLDVPVHLADYYHWSEKIPAEYRKKPEYIHLFGMMLYAIQSQHDYSWNHREKKSFLENIKHFSALILD